MGLFERVRGLFAGERGPYEESHRERVKAVRAAVGDDASTLDLVKAVVALVAPSLEEKDVEGEARLLEDLGFGDLEMTELEVLCEDLFGVSISQTELNLLDTVDDLVKFIDEKKG